MSQSVENLLKCYSSEKSELLGSQVAWVNQAREGAIEALRKDGLPSSKNEAWKYTPLQKLFDKKPAGLEGSDLKQLPDAYRCGLQAKRIVLVNGHHCPDLSDTKLPKGVLVSNLADKLEDPRVKDTLSTAPRDVVDALSFAFLKGGVFVEVAQGAQVKEVIHLVSIVTASKQKNARGESRIILWIEEEAAATVVESSFGEGSYIYSQVSDVVLRPKAKLQHYWVQQDSKKANRLNQVHARLAEEAEFDSTQFLFGSALCRNGQQIHFEGEAAKARLSGLYVGAGKQHLDNALMVNHAKPGCESEQLYKGVLTDSARGVFTGKVYVAKDAQKTDAQQANHNLVLSEEAEADTCPQLEIYADDVKCSHGATVGQLDEKALFYLQSRGIGEEEARRMLIQAFAEALLSKVTLEGLRQYLIPTLKESLGQL